LFSGGRRGIIRRSKPFGQRRTGIVLRIATTRCCAAKRVVPAKTPGSLDFLCESCGRRWVIRKSDIRDMPQPVRVLLSSPSGRRELGRLLTQGILPR